MKVRFNWIVELRTLFYALKLSGFSIIVVIAVSLLLQSSQGQDLLINLNEDGLRERLLLVFSTLFWSLNLWLWARILLNIKYPYPPGQDVEKRIPFYRALLPISFSTLGILSVLLTFYFTTNVLLYELLFTAVISVIWTPLIKCIYHRSTKPLSKDNEYNKGFLSYVKKDGYSKLAIFISLLSFGLFIYGINNPFKLALLFNTNVITLFFIWCSGFLALGSLVNYLANKHGIPIVFLIFIMTIFFSFWNDHHKIRLITTPTELQDTNRSQPSNQADLCHQQLDLKVKRPTLLEAIKHWQSINCHNGTCKPFIVVAGAGGGIRAAYWTGTVLGKFYDTAPTFNNHLFAISTVSGASLGAAVYRAGLNDIKVDQKLEKRIQRVLWHDYLTPLSSHLLYRDFFQLFVPWPLFDDRSIAFEKSLEYYYHKVMICQEEHKCVSKAYNSAQGLANPLSHFSYYQGNTWPALFFNATWSENGQRIVNSTLQLNKSSWNDYFQCLISSDKDDAYINGIKPLYNDFMSSLDCNAHHEKNEQSVDCDIALSTSIHNSARFPFVSPPGYWCYKGNYHTPSKVSSLAHCEKQSLQDGAFYENFGTRTTLEILTLAKSVMGEAFNPYVIIVTSDPSLPEDFTELLPNAPVTLRSDFLINVNSILNTRNAHNIEHVHELKRWITTNARDEKFFFHFRMCPSDATPPPLGWSLSEHSKKKIKCYFQKSIDEKTCSKLLPKLQQSCVLDNQNSFDYIINTIKTSE